MKYPTYSGKFATDFDGNLYKMEIDQPLDGLREDRFLVWNDEFDGSAIDPTKWMFRTDSANYMANAEVRNSICDFDSYYDQDSGAFGRYYMMTTGLEDIQYGRIEARMKWDAGTYPAFWLVGQTSQKYNGVTEGIIWPRAGEVDILESDNAESVFVTLHYGENEGANIAHEAIKVNPRYPVKWDTWHTFALEWTSDLMVFYCDDDEMGRVDISKIVYENGECPFRHKMYIILSGSVSAKNPDEAAHYHVYTDWVRYYAPKGILVPQELQKIKLDTEGQTISLNPNRIRELDLSYFPQWSTDFTMRWYSTDRSVAKFNAGNRIEALKEGEVDLSVVTKSGLSTGCHLRVSNDVMNLAESITIGLGKSANYGFVGESLLAKAIIAPKWATVLTANWSSSNPNVIAVDANGKLSFLTVGEATITASTKDGSGLSESLPFASRAISDTIPLDGCVRKFTRKGWNETRWADDIDASVGMNTGTYFNFEQGLGYSFSSFTSPRQNNYADVDVDTQGDWSVSEKMLLPEGNKLLTVDILRIKGSGDSYFLASTVNNGRIVFRMYDDNGDVVLSHYNVGPYVVPLTDGAVSSDFSLDVTFVHHASGQYECYANGVKLFSGAGAKTMPTMVEPKIYIGSIPGAARIGQYYQAAVVYDKALSEQEVVVLCDAFEEMFPIY